MRIQVNVSGLAPLLWALQGKDSSSRYLTDVRATFFSSLSLFCLLRQSHAGVYIVHK